MSEMLKPNTKCLQCNVEFRVKPSRLKKGQGKFCSRKCKGLWQKENGCFDGENNPQWKGGIGRETITKQCRVCGQDFKARKHQLKLGQGVYCSRKCKGMGQAGNNSEWWNGGPVQRQCVQCSRLFDVARYKLVNNEGRFCSHGCKGLWMSENLSRENSVHWLGIGKQYPQAFNSIFKKAIRARDNYTCAICHTVCQTGEAACVHHIDYIKKNTTPDNCITLCRSCHGKTNRNRKYWQARLAPIAQQREAQNG